MKKYLAIISVMIFVLGFAASAFAIHAEIPAETTAMVAKGDTLVTIGGELRFRGIIRETDFDSDTSTANGYDSRVRLSIDAKTGPVSGLIQLETSNDNCTTAAGVTTCDGNTTDAVAWGKHGRNGTGGYTYGNSKMGDLRVLQAWLQYKSDVVGVKVGHMPLALGNKIFFNHTKFGDDAIVIFADPTKGLHVAGLVIKFEDNGSANNADQDGYVVLANYNAGIWGVGGDITYVAINPSSSSPIAPGDLINIGVRGNGKAGPVNIWGDIEVQTGTFLKDTAGEVDHSAYAVVVGADAKLGAATLYFAGGMGTGPDFGAGGDSEQFVTSLGNHQNEPIDTFIYDYFVPGASGASNAGIANTTFAKVGAQAKVAGIGLDGKLVWLKATEVPSGADDDIGIEIDLKGSYKVTKNLTYWIESGYLMAGDFYGADPDNAWAVRHGVAYSF